MNRPVRSDDLLEVIPDTEAPAWAVLVEQIGRVLALEPHPNAIGDGATSREARVEQVLSLAARTEGPVLLLPLPSDGRRPLAAHRHIEKAVIASDASEPVVGAAAILYHRFADAGIPTTIVFVLTPSALPRIWEGAGYHAQAWRSELRRRHGSAAEDFTITMGEPTQEVEAAAARADVLILLWRQVARLGRAAMVRSLLGELPVPCLLVPLAWARRLAPPTPLPARAASPT